MKIQNYGEWKGDRSGGHHPPACTCYRCNEERRAEEAAKEEERRVKEYDKRVTQAKARSNSGRQQSKPNQSPPKNPAPSRNQPRSARPKQPAPTSSQQRAAQAVRQSVAGARPAVPTRPTLSPLRHGKQESKLFNISRAVTASALRYTIALHAAAIVGLVVYALVQGGAQNVMPTLDEAAKAYGHTWRTAGALVGLG